MMYDLSAGGKTISRNASSHGTITVLRECTDRVTGLHRVAMRVDGLPASLDTYNGLGFSTTSYNYTCCALHSPGAINVRFLGGVTLNGADAGQTRPLGVGDVVLFTLDCERKSVRVQINAETPCDIAFTFEPPYRFAAAMRHQGGVVSFMDSAEVVASGASGGSVLGELQAAGPLREEKVVPNTVTAIIVPFCASCAACVAGVVCMVCILWVELSLHCISRVTECECVFVTPD